MRAPLVAIAAAGALTAGAACAAVVLTDKAPYPYAQRRLLDLPLPLLTGRRLDALLQPQPGMRILEIGPGTGLQSLHVAPQLGADGELVIVDVQQQMLDHVMARAARRSIGAINLTLTTLVRLANDAGLHLRGRTGVPMAYYALLAPCAPRP